MRALVTGITGFVGRHLSAYLLAQGWQVWGTTQHKQSGLEGAQIFPADLRDPAAVQAAIDACRPDVIFHLAALAAVGPSHLHPWDTLSANIAMQSHVLEAVRHSLTDCTVIVIGSGEEYGLARAADLPLHEEAPLRPTSPYAVSKLTQDFLGLQYHLAYGLKVVRVRPFNHIGPGQGLGFVASDFAKQLASAEAGLTEPVIRVGNLTAQRDFSDVRDVVRAYFLLAEKGKPGEVYNVASGRAMSVEELLHLLLAECRVKVALLPDAARMRPSDVPVFYGDSSKLQQATGWRIQIPIEETIRDIMEYWRAKVAAEENG